MNTNNNDNARHSATDHDLSRPDDTGREIQKTDLGIFGEINYANNRTNSNITNDAAIHDKPRPVAPGRDQARHFTTERDLSRQDATEPIEETKTDTNEQTPAGYNATDVDKGDADQDSKEQTPLKQSSWIEINQTIGELERQGIKRTVRSVQRYCNRGKLTCKLVPTENSVRYLIEKSSIADFVKQHNESMPSQGFSSQSDDREHGPNLGTEQLANMDKIHIAQSNQQSELILSLKDQQIDMLKSQLTVTNKQLDMKDEQISAMLERDHETNVLIQNLQNLMALPSAGQTSPHSREVYPKSSMNDEEQQSTSNQSADIR